MILQKAYIGVDPGFSKSSPGAVALVCGREIDVRDWESLEEMGEQLRTWQLLYPIHSAAIEKVHAHVYLKRDRRTGAVVAQSQKGSANFDFGANYGMWQGLMVGLGIPYELVPPSEWQPTFQLRKKRGKNDKPSLDVAREKYPGAPLKFKKYHGRADALLIATWLRQKHEIIYH